MLVSDIIMCKMISTYQLLLMLGFCSWQGGLCFCNYKLSSSVPTCWKKKVKEKNKTKPRGKAFPARLRLICVTARLLNTALLYCQTVQVYFEEDRLYFPEKIVCSWNHSVAGGWTLCKEAVTQQKRVFFSPFFFLFEGSGWGALLMEERVENLGFWIYLVSEAWGTSLPLPSISPLSLAPNLSQ